MKGWTPIPIPILYKISPTLNAFYKSKFGNAFTQSTVKDPVEEGGQGDERCLHGRDGGDGGHGGVRKGIIF